MQLFKYLVQAHTCKFRMHYQVDVNKNNPCSSKENILWCNQFSFFCKHAGFWRWVSQAWLWWQPCWREQAGSYEGTCGIAGYLCLLRHGETGYPFHQLQTKTEKSKTFLQCLAMLCHFQHWMTKQYKNSKGHMIKEQLAALIEHCSFTLRYTPHRKRK